ncbi:MAG: hypothetical protein ACI4S3_05690 [Candidatus Gastranaerophilaceae bacterium]
MNKELAHIQIKPIDENVLEFLKLLIETDKELQGLSIKNKENTK